MGCGTCRASAALLECKPEHLTGQLYNLLCVQAESLRVASVLRVPLSDVVPVISALGERSDELNKIVALFGYGLSFRVIRGKIEGLLKLQQEIHTTQERSGTHREVQAVAVTQGDGSP